MSDLVLIPVMDRAEYLYLCLEHILKADGGQSKRVWVSQDRRAKLSPHPDIAAVVKQFEGKFAELRFIQRTPHSYIGNPSNFLELYKEAEQTDARYVYLIEDDVFVGKDFFMWHETVQELHDYFCSIGWHCIRNAEAIVKGDAEGVVESERDFSSIGVCWKRENLAPVVKHARREYYSDLSGYLGAQFPNSSIPKGQWTEQAGLIMRILLETPGAVVAWAALPRCAHVGISGYHRNGGFKFQGTLEQRIAALRKASSETKALVSLSKDVFDDVAALPEVPPWKELRVVQRFEGKHA